MTGTASRSYEILVYSSWVWSQVTSSPSPAATALRFLGSNSASACAANSPAATAIMSPAWGFLTFISSCQLHQDVGLYARSCNNCIKFLSIYALAACNMGFPGRNNVWLKFTASEDKPHAPTAVFGPSFPLPVILAKAGIHFNHASLWIPAFAGTTDFLGARSRFDRSDIRIFRFMQQSGPPSMLHVQTEPAFTRQPFLPADLATAARACSQLDRSLPCNTTTFIHANPRITFATTVNPASPSRVRIDSGWNCTAATGSSGCSTAITMPSSLSAVTCNASGNVPRSA